MSGVSRRQVLQFGASALAAIGLNQLDFLNQANQFDRALAQSPGARTTPRKHALLVGINDYAIDPLRGCINDVKSMRILLENRYDFDPTNITQLTDAQATRQGILTAWEQLINKVEPGDVVVFHFSGHGYMVQDSDPNPGFVYDNQGVNGTLIPYDWNQGKDGSDRVIMGHTLFLLTSALRTENVTVVLDCCHSAGGLRGNSRVRSFSRSNSQISKAPQEELEYQQTWLSKLKISEPEYLNARKRGIAKGVGIGATTLEQESVDAEFKGFSAGAFTYLLTRYLWQQPSSQSLDAMFTNLQLGTQMLAMEKKGMVQVPNYEVKPGSQNAQQPIFFTTKSRPTAEAVIHEAPQPGQPIKFWLGGVAPRTLTDDGTGAVFTLIDSQGRAVGKIVQTTPRKELEAAGILQSGQVQPMKGMLLREEIRNLPPNFKLKVGLDPSLESLRPTIQQSFNRFNWLEFIEIPSPQSVDYIIGRMTSENLKRLRNSSQKLPSVNAISLFDKSQIPVPDSFDSADEPLTAMIARLRSRLKSLYAGEVLYKVMGNASSLKVSAEVFVADAKNNPIGPSRTLTTRGLRSISTQTQTLKPAPIKLGSYVGVTVKNEEPDNLYVAILFISDSGEMGVLFPYGVDAPELESLVKARQEFTLEHPFEVNGTPGFLELLILASREPLRQALLALKNISAKDPEGLSGSRSAGLRSDDADKVVSSLLGDIDRISTRSPYMKSSSRAIDTSKLAVLSTVFEAVQ